MLQLDFILATVPLDCVSATVTSRLYSGDYYN